jgi:predicted GIY-YIG superfamily endonuclease
MAAHSVYWIRAPEHTDMFSQGYIGVSNNSQRRFVEHSRAKSNRHLAFAIQKHGWDTLVKTEILVADVGYCLDIEAKLRPSDKIGWNLVAGGGKPPVLTGDRPVLRGRSPWNKGKKMSQSTVEKVRAAVTKQMENPEHRALLSRIKLGKPSGRLGIKHTAETIEKMRLSKIGNTFKKKGVKLTPEAYANTVAAARVKWSCPHCGLNGMGKGAANRWHFDACKNKEMT